MNCLSCHNSYKLYDKTNNCLNCPKYVNYLQTECIDIIPDGYYLSDEIYGIIEKCHNLCKTCKSGPGTKNNKIYMNCESCVEGYYIIDGNCEESHKIDNGGEQRENNNSNDSSFNWILIVLVILIVIVIGIIIYFKYFKNRISQRNSNDYFNYGGGQNIPFEDENNIGIN